MLPVHYPKELLTALGVLAVELWGPPGPPRGDDAGRIQTYVCAVVRNALAFLASGGADAVDGGALPAHLRLDPGAGHARPRLRRLGQAGVHASSTPRAPARPSARALPRRPSCARLARELEALHRATARRRARSPRPSGSTREIDAAARRAARRARRASPLDDRELYALLRRGEWLWPEDHLAELAAAAAGAGRARRCSAGVPVLVTGYVPEPMALLDALDRAGAFVAADDYAAVGRRVRARRRRRPRADPWRGARGARTSPRRPARPAAPIQTARVRHLAGAARARAARAA